MIQNQLNENAERAIVLRRKLDIIPYQNALDILKPLRQLCWQLFMTASIIDGIKIIAEPNRMYNNNACQSILLATAYMMSCFSWAVYPGINSYQQHIHSELLSSQLRHVHDLMQDLQDSMTKAFDRMEELSTVKPTLFFSQRIKDNTKPDPYNSGAIIPYAPYTSFSCQK